MSVCGVELKYNSEPFDFEIIRSKSKTIIFSTYLSTFIYSNYYIELGTEVANNKIFGLGRDFQWILENMMPNGRCSIEQVINRSIMERETILMVTFLSTCWLIKTTKPISTTLRALMQWMCLKLRKTERTILLLRLLEELSILGFRLETLISFSWYKIFKKYVLEHQQFLLFGLLDFTSRNGAMTR